MDWGGGGNLGSYCHFTFPITLIHFSVYVMPRMQPHFACGCKGNHKEAHFEDCALTLTFIPSTHMGCSVCLLCFYLTSSAAQDLLPALSSGMSSGEIGELHWVPKIQSGLIAYKKRAILILWLQHLKLF